MLPLGEKRNQVNTRQVSTLPADRVNSRPSLLILRQQLVDSPHRHRRAVEVALRLIAVEQPQQLELIRGLDAFGHGQQAERRREADDGARERHAGVVARQPFDEAAVDLEKIHVQLGQQTEGRISRAEIVQRNPNSRGAQLPQLPAGAVDVLQQRGLGDLQIDAETARIARPILDQIEHEIDEVPSTKLYRRDVDRDAYRAQPDPPPSVAVLQGALHHPFADRNDQSGRLQHGQEARGEHQAVFGMVPSQKRFEGFDVTADNVDLRLVVDLELLLVDRLAQPVLEHHPFGNFTAHLELVVQVLFAGFLRVLERRLGLLYQGAAVLSVDAVARHSRVAGNADTAAFDPEGLGEHRLLEQRCDARVGADDAGRGQHEGAAAQVADALVAAGLLP